MTFAFSTSDGKVFSSMQAIITNVNGSHLMTDRQLGPFHQVYQKNCCHLFLGHECVIRFGSLPNTPTSVSSLGQRLLIHGQ